MVWLPADKYWCEHPLMTDKVRETMDGALGHFWTDLNDVYKLDESSDGYVKLGTPSDGGKNMPRAPRVDPPASGVGQPRQTPQAQRRSQGLPR